ncbi:MAG TPA: fused MFS/spermidine synthase [Pseudomonadales bacterium]|nr:fused MFS/spermidine synthase [Pseudomonadales bacterium]
MQKAVIYLLAFSGGFSIMSIELLGGRILAPWFGSSVYVWGSIITVFMLALSAGYLVGGRLSVRNPSLTRYGVLFIAGAVLIAPLLFFGEALMELVFEAVQDPRYGSLLASLLLFLAPTVLLGMISPYSVRLLVRQTEHSGEVAGFLYFVSTFGSALGTLGTSFYFVLWFEMDTILYGLITLLVLCGLIAMATDRVTETTS